MAIQQNGGGLPALRTLFSVGTLVGLTDRQLLERFTNRRGEVAESAFAALVDRHGPLVLSVCRARLRDEHESLDAFQATFLVLMHKAGSLWVRDSLAPWLHAVAFRVASRARSSAARRRGHERQFAERAAVCPDGDEVGDGADLRLVLHEEIHRLPERFRIPVVLCDLEGRTHQQAAEQLGWPIGTVKSRQARGRERLRHRLVRRGVTPTVGLGAVLASQSARAAVPVSMANSTVQIASRLATGAAGAGAVSAPVAVLVKGVLNAMFLNKLGFSTLILLAAGVTAGALWQFAGPSPAASAEKTPAPAAKTRKGPGKIYTTTLRRAPVENGESYSMVAIDPESGERTTVLDGCQDRPRVSPDGRTVVFVRGDTIYTRSVAGGDEPVRILRLEVSISGGSPVWSPDGKRIIISLGKKADVQKHEPWVFKTVRVNADGTGRTELKVPPEDGVQDWSSDGEWLLTASSRNAKIGWQLYVMRPDGAGQRQITEGGNPYYARFSPDGRRIVYTDGTTDERRGIWVVGIDGKDRRRVFATEVTKQSTWSACWSPDGKRIAVLLWEGGEGRVVVMDADGGHQIEHPLPGGAQSDMPDWR